MAITTTFNFVNEKYQHQKKHWNSFEEFEEYFLQEIAEKGEWNYYKDKTGVERQIPKVDHFPVLKEYEVWMEGYRATGEEGPAHLVGRTHARNFRQACNIIMCTQYLRRVTEENNPAFKGYAEKDWCYNPSNLSFWGCGLYMDEKRAKQSFG
jgi:hypothetical protein